MMVNVGMGQEFQFGKMKGVLEMDGGDGRQHCMYLMPQKCTLKNS